MKRYNNYNIMVYISVCEFFTEKKYQKFPFQFIIDSIGIQSLNVFLYFLGQNTQDYIGNLNLREQGQRPEPGISGLEKAAPPGELDF